MAEIDMVNRDPNGINSHLGLFQYVLSSFVLMDMIGQNYLAWTILHFDWTLHFDDVIGEPDGIHSLDCVWKVSFKCFECWKLLTYNLLTIFYGICIAAEWACEFAYIAFWHIWIISPMMKVFEINCGVCQRIWANCVNCCVVPCCEAFGAVFHAFKK